MRKTGKNNKKNKHDFAVFVENSQKKLLCNSSTFFWQSIENYYATSHAKSIQIII